MASFEYAGNDDNDDEFWTQAWDAGTNSLIVQLTERRPGMASQIKESLVEQNSVNVDIPKVTAQPQNGDVMITTMALNDNKAGMEGLDKESINRIIYKASKGSSFYENEKRKEEMTNQRIQMQNDKLKKLTTDQIALGISKADDLLEMLESSRDLSRTIVHIDMDAFYAAVEMLEKPELKDKPMAVGGASMISTSNYAARRFGVRAGMPGFIGRKLCPELVLVPCNFEKYGNFSRRIRKIFAEYDPNFSPVGLDEAYLDLTNYLISLKDGTSQSSDDQISVDDSSTVVQERLKTEGSDAQTPTSNSEGQACDDQAHISDDQAHMTHDQAHISHDQAQMSHDQAQMSHDQAHMTHDQAHISHDQAQMSHDQAQISHDQAQMSHDQAHMSHDQAHVSHDQAQMSHDQAQMSHDQAHMSHDQAHTSDSKEADRDHESGLSDPQEHASLAAKVVDEIRSRIFKETGLTASAGIAANSMLAKVCSDRNKPNGQFEIESTKESVHEFIRDLPIRKICGIGKVTEKMLKSLGIVTCQQLHDKRGILFHLYSAISFDYFMRIALGIGATRIERDCERKSMSVERTFSEMNKPSQLQDMCWQLSEMLSEDLSNEDMMGKTVTLKIKTVKFEVKTRAHTLPSHTQSAEQIFGAASSLLKTEIKACLPAPLRLRLMGVRLSSLLPAADVPSRNQTTISSMMKRQTMPATATLEASQTTNSEMDATCSAANINSPTKTDSNDPTDSNASEISECETVVENGAREFAPCEIKTFVCPICNIAQPTEGLIDLNRHIDECLNRRQVREILADDSKKKKSRCDELPEATNGKRQKLNKSKPASAGSLLKYFNSNG